MKPPHCLCRGGEEGKILSATGASAPNPQPDCGPSRRAPPPAPNASQLPEPATNAAAAAGNPRPATVRAGGPPPPAAPPAPLSPLPPPSLCPALAAQGASAAAISPAPARWCLRARGGSVSRVPAAPSGERRRRRRGGRAAGWPLAGLSWAFGGGAEAPVVLGGRHVCGPNIVPEACGEGARAEGRFPAGEAAASAGRNHSAEGRVGRGGKEGRKGRCEPGQEPLVRGWGVGGAGRALSGRVCVGGSGRQAVGSAGRGAGGEGRGGGAGCQGASECSYVVLVLSADFLD